MRELLNKPAPLRLHFTRFPGVLFSLLALSLTSACSPEMFSSKKQDDSVLQTPSFRESNSKCSGINLATDEINPSNFRGLINCFNSDHSIQNLSNLISETNDEELKPFTDLLTRSLLKDPKTLYEMEETFYQMKEEQKLDSLLQALSIEFNNDKRISALLEVFFHFSKSDKAIASASQILNELSPAEIERLITLVYAISESPASKGLSLININQSFTRAAIETVLDLLPTTLTKTILNAIIDQSVFQLIDQSFGKTETELKKSIPENQVLMSVFGQNAGDAFVKNSHIFKTLNQPVYCMRKSIKHDAQIDVALTHLARQPTLDAFVAEIQTGAPLKFALLSESCDFPSTLKSDYSSLIDLSESNGVNAMYSFIKTTDGNAKTKHLLKEFFLLDNPKLLGNGISKISSFADWEDLLSTMISPHIEDRAFFSRLSTLTLKRIDDLTPPLLTVDREKLTQALNSSSDSKLLSKAYDLIKMNDRTPITNMLKKELSNTAQIQTLARSMVALTQKKSFIPALHELSKTALNGQLKELIFFNFSLFHKFAKKGNDPSNPIQKKNVPAIDIKTELKFTLSQKDFLKLPLKSNRPQIANACESLQFSLDSSNLNNFFSCLKSRPDKSSQALSAASTIQVSNQKNLITWVIDAIDTSTKNLSAAQIRSILNTQLDLIRDHTLVRMSKEISVIYQKIKNTFFATIGPLATKQIELFELSKFLSAELRADTFPALLTFFSENWDAKEKLKTWPKAKPFLDSTTTDAEIKSALKSIECENKFPDINEKISTIRQEYSEAVNNLERKDAYTWNEFQLQLSSIFASIQSPLQDSRTKSLPSAVVSFLKSQSGKDLYQWLKDRSEQTDTIAYYYPEDKKPTVRLASNLDKLELVLTNADFTYIIPENFGLKFLAEIGEAWGDEPEDKWPAEIREKFKDSKPKKLRDAYNSMQSSLSMFESVIGYPWIPACMPEQYHQISAGVGRVVPEFIPKSIFNLRQVMSAVEENLPDSKNAKYRGGARLLRNLFFHLYYSTPEEHRKATSGLKNNLSIFTRLIRFGAMKQLAHQIQQSNLDEKILIQAFSATDAALKNEKAATALIRILFRNPNDLKQTLLWNISKNLFERNRNKDASIEELKSALTTKLVILSKVNSEKLIPQLNRMIYTYAAEIAKFSDGILTLLAEKPTLNLMRSFSQSTPDDLSQLTDFFYRALLNPAVTPNLFSITSLYYDQSPNQKMLRMLLTQLSNSEFSPEYRQRAVNYLSAKDQAGLRLSLSLANFLATPESILQVMAKNQESFSRLGDALTEALKEGSFEQLLAFVQLALEGALSR